MIPVEEGAELMALFNLFRSRPGRCPSIRAERHHERLSITGLLLNELAVR